MLSESYCWEEKGIGFNHEIIIKVQELSPNIIVTMNPMVCKSLSKGLIM
jgi:hypothetical protein